MEHSYTPAAVVVVLLVIGCPSYVHAAQASECLSGTRWNGKACEDCPPGTFQGEFGQTQCEPCPAGTAIEGPGESVSCNSCSLGAYQPKSGQAKCLDCPAGTYSGDSRDGGELSCTKCPAGSYSEGAASECSLCDPGTYQSATGQSKCLECTGRTYTDKEGQKSCTKCPAGYARKVDSCTPCEPGLTTDGDADACFYCSPYSYQTKSAQATCDSCPKGTSTFSYGASAAADCKKYAPGTISFSMSFTYYNRFNNANESSDSPPVTTTMTSGEYEPDCSKVTFKNGKTGNKCADYYVFALSDSEVRFLIASKDGVFTQCDAVVGEEQTCTVQSNSGSLGGDVFENIVLVKILVESVDPSGGYAEDKAGAVTGSLAANTTDTTADSDTAKPPTASTKGTAASSTADTGDASSSSNASLAGGPSGQASGAAGSNSTTQKKNGNGAGRLSGAAEGLVVGILAAAMALVHG